MVSRRQKMESHARVRKNSVSRMTPIVSRCQKLVLEISERYRKKEEREKNTKKQCRRNATSTVFCFVCASRRKRGEFLARNFNKTQKSAGGLAIFRMLVKALEEGFEAWLCQANRELVKGKSVLCRALTFKISNCSLSMNRSFFCTGLSIVECFEVALFRNEFRLEFLAEKCWVLEFCAGSFMGASLMELLFAISPTHVE